MQATSPLLLVHTGGAAWAAAGAKVARDNPSEAPSRPILNFFNSNLRYHICLSVPLEVTLTASPNNWNYKLYSGPTCRMFTRDFNKTCDIHPE